MSVYKLLLRQNIIIDLAILLAITTSTINCNAQASKSNNIALGHIAKFSPNPNYHLSTDSGDKYQLTDGKLAELEPVMWMQKKSTVGWSVKLPIFITVDLGKVQPISGAAIHTSAGASGVHWPAGIRMLVSDDGKKYHPIGPLKIQGPKTGWNNYQTRWYSTSALQTHGRYVKLKISSGWYFFADEIRILRGQSEWLDKPLPQPAFTFDNLKHYRLYSQGRRRIEKDLKRVQTQIVSSSLAQNKKQTLLNQLQDLRKQMLNDPKAVMPGKTTILPLNDLDKQILGVWGKFLSETGISPLSAQTANPWDYLTWISRPDNAHNQFLTATVYAMEGEVRPATINLTNATDQPMAVQISVQGLNQNAGLQSIDKVIWTDTRVGKPIAAALIKLKKEKGKYTLSIPAGVTQQLWLNFKPKASGEFSGQFLAKTSDGRSVKIALNVNVFNIKFPSKTILRLGGWDYTNPGRTVRAVTKTNRKKIVTLLQSYGVDTPWATKQVLPFGKFDKKGNLTISPDLTNFDKWIKMWPDAKRYAIFLHVSKKLAGFKYGTTAFKTAAKQWASYVAKHAISKGIQPEQIMLLFIDEPRNNKKKYELSIAWANAINSANTGITTWTDPSPPKSKALRAKFRKAFDNFCIKRKFIVDNPKKYLKICQKLVQMGKTVEIYETTGPMKLQDPYSYIRLQAWRAWQVGAKASSFWSFTANSKTSDWMPYLTKSPLGPYTSLFIDNNSATPGKHIAAMRIGVEDYQYLAMLKNYLQNKNKLSQNMILQGKTLLKSAPKRVLKTSGLGENSENTIWSYPKNRTVANQMRIKIGKWLEKAHDAKLKVASNNKYVNY